MVERLKREVSMVQLAAAKGIKLKGNGENLLGLCPIHDDRTPSFVVSPSKNLWHCLVDERCRGSSCRVRTAPGPSRRSQAATCDDIERMVAHMQGAEQEQLIALARPSDAEIAQQIRHVVFPLLAVVVG